MIHEVGRKQVKRQLPAVTHRTRIALSFAQTFGLMPQRVIMSKVTGEQVTTQPPLIDTPYNRQPLCN